MKRLVPVFGALAAAMMLLASSAASAQPYGPPPGEDGEDYEDDYQQPAPGYGQPPPGYGPPAPRPRVIGFGGSFGLGFMQNQYDDLACDGCDYQPLAFGGNIYGGIFLTPQLMLLAEGDITSQRLDDFGSSYLLQYTFILGARLNLNPALYLKGGLGWAGLDIFYDDAFGGFSEELASGGALSLGVGYEFLRAPHYGADASFKFTAGGYDALNDTIYTGLFQIGFNWYL